MGGAMGVVGLTRPGIQFRIQRLWMGAAVQPPRRPDRPSAYCHAPCASALKATRELSVRDGTLRGADCGPFRVLGVDVPCR